MFAVFESGGKQHRVTSGERIRLERLDAEPGAEVEFDRVLMLGDDGEVTIGEPFVAGGKVRAEVLGHDRYRKIRIIKFRRRQNPMTRGGHRQWYTEVKITGISG